MRVLHFSDSHLEDGFRGASSALFANKRFAGYLNLRLRRRKLYRDAAAKLDALARFAEAQAVDAVICTGDYSALGTEPEIAYARRLVEPIVHGRAFATVPGNHDIYLPDARGIFERHFGDGLSSDLDVAVEGPWPSLRLLGDRAAVVGVNSARPNPPLFRSSGRIPERQLEPLPAIFARPELEGRFVFVITHYAPRLKSGRPDVANHGLENAEAFLTAAQPAWGAILHGHVHHCYQVRVPESPLPIFNSGSTTYAGREGLWLFEVDAGEARATRGHFAEGAYRLGDERYVLPAPR